MEKKREEKMYFIYLFPSSEMELAYSAIFCFPRQMLVTSPIMVLFKCFSSQWVKSQGVQGRAHFFIFLKHFFLLCWCFI